MTANGSGPAAVATAVEARKIDQLGGLIDPPDDQRSPWARRLRDIIELHVGDLGGPEALSEAKRSLTRRASTITIELERLESKFAVGRALDSDLDLYQRGANSLRRLLETIGVERIPKDVTDLPRYLAQLKQADQRSKQALEGDDA